MRITCRSFLPCCGRFSGSRGWLSGLFSMFMVGALIANSVAHAQSRADWPLPALIALFGDSISVGFQLNIPGPLVGSGSTDLGCPDIYLEHILRNEVARSAQMRCPTTSLNSPVLDAAAQSGEERDAVVVNWGITGSNTVDGLARVVQNLNQSRSQFPERTRRFSLINYGTNDINDGISVSATRFNLQEIVRKTRADAGFVPVITTILPRSDASNIIDNRVFVINDAIRQIVVEDPALGFVDLFNEFVNFPGGWPQLIRLENFGQGFVLRIHPTDQGYLFIAERWFDLFLRDALEPLPSAPVILVPILDLLLD